MKTAFVAAALSAFAVAVSSAAVPEPVAQEAEVNAEAAAAAAPIASLWKDRDFHGPRFDVTSRGCKNLPAVVNNAVSSYKIFRPVTCTFWDGRDCSRSGPALFSRRGPVEVDPVAAQFNNRITSVSCS